MGSAIAWIGRRNRRGLFVAMIFCLAAAAGCGPSLEEIQARQRAQAEAKARARAAAEAKRLAEQQRQERLRAAEAAGTEAARTGQLDRALERYMEVLRDIDRYGEQDQRVRMLVVATVRAMPAPPPLPESVVRGMVRGETLVKMGGAGSYEAAAREMEAAALAAPWLADAYYNLAVVQEKAELYRQAISNLRLYLYAAPEAQNANAIKARIYALEVMEEEQHKIRSLAGKWRTGGGNTFTVTIDGKRVKAAGSWDQPLDSRSYQTVWYAFDLEKKGAALEGTVTVSREGNHGCEFPVETVPASGTVRGNGESVRIEWKETRFSWTWQGALCTGVGSLGKQALALELVEHLADPKAARAEEAELEDVPTEETKPAAKALQKKARGK